MAAADWPHVGRYTQAGGKGFRRADVLPWTVPFANGRSESRWCCLRGVRELVSDGKGGLTVRYFGQKKAVKGRTPKVTFGVWTGGRREQCEQTTSRKFLWRADGVR